MTAKTRHGHAAHHRAHGSDEGTAHERLNKRHAQPGRPEGAMHTGGEMAAPAAAPMPPPATPPMGGAPMGGDPSMGAGPSTGGDDEGGLS